MRTLVESARLEIPGQPYIYHIIDITSPPLKQSESGRPNFAQYAAISSDDSLLYIEANKSSIRLLDERKNIHKGVTCIAQSQTSHQHGRPHFATAGRDGQINVWDAAHRTLIRTFNTPTPNEPISALACDHRTGTIAVGTELEGYAPGDVAIYVFQPDRPTEPTQYTQSHSDTITALAFAQPVQPHSDIDYFLLSASADGLVNAFDLRAEGEDDALVGSVNAQGPVNHIQPVLHSVSDDSCTNGGGMMNVDTQVQAKDVLPAVWVVTQDEKVRLCSFEDREAEDEVGEGDRPEEVLDLREKLSVDYAVKTEPVFEDSRGLSIIAGANKPETAAPFLSWTVLRSKEEKFDDMKTLMRFDGAHGEEVVRDLWVSSMLLEEEHDVRSLGDWVPTALTVGEDGVIKIWRISSDAAMEDTSVKGAATGDMKRNARQGSSKNRKRRKHSESGQGRYKPY